MAVGKLLPFRTELQKFFQGHEQARLVPLADLAESLGVVEYDVPVDARRVLEFGRELLGGVQRVDEQQIGRVDLDLAGVRPRGTSGGARSG